MDHHFTIASEEEEENFLRESVRCPSMNRVLRSEYHRGRKSKFNRKNRHNKQKSKAKWSKGKRERIQQKLYSCDVIGESDTDYHDSYSYCDMNEPVNRRDCARYNKHYNSSQVEQADQRKNEWDDSNQILPAEELGIEDGSMYDRLISILEGDDITPEDYDLLRLLDDNNAVTTLDENEISKFETFTIGAIDVNCCAGSNDDGHRYKNLLQESLKCDICLESWSDLPKETEVRCLPCNHVFCKSCIDDWLSQRSQKCPNLSCYWALEEGGDD